METFLQLLWIFKFSILVGVFFSLSVLFFFLSERKNQEKYNKTLSSIGSLFLALSIVSSFGVFFDIINLMVWIHPMLPLISIGLVMAWGVYILVRDAIQQPYLKFEYTQKRDLLFSLQ
jgi:hypothetical protein